MNVTLGCATPAGVAESADARVSKPCARLRETSPDPLSGRPSDDRNPLAVRALRDADTRRAAGMLAALTRRSERQFVAAAVASAVRETVHVLAQLQGGAR